jgi:cation transport ATPase
MSKCPGLHCDGCGGGRGWAVLVVLAVIAAAVYKARHIIEVAIEVVFWTIIGAAGLALAGGLVYGAVRWRASARARRPRTVIPARAEVVRLGAEPVDMPAIEAPRPASARWPLPGGSRTGHKL